MQSLVFSIEREVAAEGITVNGISPAYVRTPMVRPTRESMGSIVSGEMAASQVTQQLTKEQQAAVLAQIPVKRFCEPQEFAHTVKFLASPLAGFITGEIIDQNGGFHMD